MNGYDNTISVTGNSEFNVDPDKAEIWILVESRGHSAKTAHAVLQQETNRVIDALKEEGLSESKINILINTIKTRSDFWRNMLIFSNTQDAFFGLSKLQSQNEEILKVLRELLTIFKKSQTGTNPTYLQ